MGDGPCINPPNILRSTVIGCEAKYELTKKKVSRKNIFSEIEVFGQEKGSYTLYFQISDKIESKKVVRNFGTVKRKFLS